MLRKALVLLVIGIIVFSIKTTVTAEEASGSAAQEEWGPRLQVRLQPGPRLYVKKENS